MWSLFCMGDEEHISHSPQGSSSLIVILRLLFARFSETNTLPAGAPASSSARQPTKDRKSTRLNSSHTVISYAVFCLKKKKITDMDRIVGTDSESARIRAACA